MKSKSLGGLRVTVMGLGLNGGGLASARFLVEQGAQVTVTDLRGESELGPSLEALRDLPVRYVLGRHDESDFALADFVVKNPAVRPDNPYLRLARRVETDLSLFLTDLPNPILAVTGSKGKSTTVTALHHILKQVDPNVRLGGNITVSPLSFLSDLAPSTPVVLELSSWQLSDLRGRGVLKPRLAAVTNLLWDHMNVYPSQEDYARDKAVLLESVPAEGKVLLPADNAWGPWFAQRSPVPVSWIGAASSLPLNGDVFSLDDGSSRWTDLRGRLRGGVLLPERLRVPGAPFRRNCLGAAALAALWGLESNTITEALASFAGVEHRMELVESGDGVLWYNDTAATIPEAATASAASFSQPLHWILGGTDKDLDLAALESHDPAPASVILLDGSATRRMLPLLERRGWPLFGPFTSMDQAVDVAAQRARPGDVVLLSPGAASFELFRNEFYRGQAFRDAVRRRRDMTK